MNLLLQLPVELRLNICNFIIPVDPLAVPSTDYSGLLFSCRAIRDELEPEVCKRIARSIYGIAARIRNKGDEIIYAPPTTIYEWRNLTVSRPRRPAMFAKKDPFLTFKYFYFDTLTITFHDAPKDIKPESSACWLSDAASGLAREIGRWHLFERYPAMQRWRLDWRAYPQKTMWFKLGLEIALREGGGDGWEAEAWIDERGRATGVCFYQRPKAETRRR